MLVLVQRKDNMHSCIYISVTVQAFMHVICACMYVSMHLYMYVSMYAYMYVFMYCM